MKVNEWHDLPLRLSVLSRFSLAIVLFLFAVGARLLLLPVDAHVAYITFYPTIFITLYICGEWPGAIVALAFSAVAYIIFTEPFYSISFKTTGLTYGGVFLASSLMFGAVIESSREWRQKLIDYEATAARQALDKAEQALQLASEGGELGLWTWDVITNEVTWTNKCRQIFGLSPIEDVSYTTFITAVYSEDREAVEKAIETSFTNGSEFKLEYRIVRRDQIIRNISAVGRTYTDDSGRPVRMQGALVDITERRELERNVVNIEVEFRNLAEAMPQIVWATNPGGENIYFNSRWVEYTGLSLHESYGHGWNIPFHADDRGVAWRAWRSAVERKGAYSIECRLCRKDGVYRWWLIRGVPSFDESGEIYRWYGTCTDIDDLKGKEVELLQANQYLTAAVTNINEAFILCDRNEKFIIFNQAASKFYRLDQHFMPATYKQLANQTIVTDLNGNEVAVWDRPIPRALRGQRGVVEANFRLKDGNEQWFGRYSYAPMYNDSGEIIGAACVASDITSRVKIEMEVIDLNKNLQTKVQERTAELEKANQKLAESARHDALTGLYNRLAADELMRREYVRMKRHTRPYAVFMVDVDFFRRVNDAYGHHVGDEVLIQIAKTLQGSLRESDNVFRYGGEEFLVLLPYTDFEVAHIVAEKLRVAISDKPHPIAGEQHISIGIGIASPEQEDEDVAIKEADNQLYEGPIQP